MTAARGFGGTTDAGGTAEGGAGALVGSEALAGATDAGGIAASGGTASGGLDPEGGLSGARPLGGCVKPAEGCAAPGIGGRGDFEGRVVPGLGTTPAGEAGDVVAGTGLGGNLSGGSLTGPPVGAGKGALGGEVSLTVKKRNKSYNPMA